MHQSTFTDESYLLITVDPKFIVNEHWPTCHTDPSNITHVRTSINQVLVDLRKRRILADRGTSGSQIWMAHNGPRDHGTMGRWTHGSMGPWPKFTRGQWARGPQALKHWWPKPPCAPSACEKPFNGPTNLQFGQPILELQILETMIFEPRILGANDSGTNDFENMCVWKFFR